MVFEDRRDAGIRLAQELLPYQGEDTLVLALPRGGVIVAFEVAEALGAPLDVMVARKLGAPGQPELGIGAVAPGGVLIYDEFLVRYLGLGSDELKRLAHAETLEMERRLKRYRGDRPLPAIEGRTVILVDDGLATGVTARAAIQAVRKQGARRLVLAVPVCAPETASKIQSEVDDLVCLSAPSDFRAVGLWYRRFDQTSDEEVIECLRLANNHPMQAVET
jgi:predicted phosphoribosyltransferase